jgi:hypothetical protein
MLLRGYRFLFFDRPNRDPAAVFILSFADDKAAIVEAGLLLGVSSHSNVEVWRGSQRVHMQEGMPDSARGAL